MTDDRDIVERLEERGADRFRVNSDGDLLREAAALIRALDKVVTEYESDYDGAGLSMESVDVISLAIARHAARVKRSAP